MENQNERKNKTNLIALLFIIFFLYNGYNFLITEENEHPLLGFLFNMIIFLAALVFLYHKKDIEEGKNELIGQTSLERYFKKKKG